MGRPKIAYNGCFISKSEYKKEMETQTILPIFFKTSERINGILFHLEVIHNVCMVKYWKEEIEKVAVQNNLIP